MTNIALLNFIPRHCPECGRNLVQVDHGDFRQGRSHACGHGSCTFKYQYVLGPLLLEEAALHGDLHVHVTQWEVKE